jgi:hypothetical protein
MDPQDRWLDGDAGPIVRPYAMVRGRTAPDGHGFDLMTVVTATVVSSPPSVFLTPEHQRLLALCQRPALVADMASDIDLPLGVVRVLLGDLKAEHLISVHMPQSTGHLTDEFVLKGIIDGLRAL